MTKIWIAAAACMAAVSSIASGALLQARNIPLDLALEIAQEAVQECTRQQHSVSAAVVDREGVLRALLRADNAGSHTPGAARRKAYTSASTRTATSAMVKTIQQNPDAAQLVAIDDFLILGGGVPIKAGNETVGAIGVGGAPSGDLDEGCATVALEKIAAKLV
ncbi:hypothetical protein IF1G_04010 [Cordyceps javanica]|uniref:Heme-binding protein n=1 Tax=Cordyceps javanica TaxID=43265 RepID=A0A545W286_9HYPO|nr:hypothetical protein IF1G_04010 [Cordyceps javanica]TQW08036.1 GAF domain-containing protein [Cordyceps javanica]